MASNHDPIANEKAEAPAQLDVQRAETVPDGSQSDSSHTLSLPASAEPDSEKPLKTLDFNFLPIPKHLRYHTSHPPTFSLTLNILFGVGGTFGELKIM